MHNVPVASPTSFHSSKTEVADEVGLVPVVLTAMGCIALLVGLLVYVIDRDACKALPFPAAGCPAGLHVFGAMGQWLPSFVHPFAFILFTAAALPMSGRPRYLACLTWFSINVLFEVGQYPRFSESLARAIQDTFGANVLTRPFATFFIRGTFDGGDILAAALGSLAAAGVLCVAQRRMENHGAQ